MTSKPVSDPGAPVSSSDAAFAGLRLLRREPRTFLIWSAAALILSTAMVAVLVGLAGPSYMQLQALGAAGASKPDPAAMAAVFGALVPAYLVMMILWLAVAAVMNAAAVRAVLRPGPDGRGHIRFGADELRQMAVLVLLGLILFGVYVVELIVIGLVAASIAVATGAAGGVASGGAMGVMVMAGLVELVMVVVGGALLAFFGVRLSLASALTFDTGKVRIFGSWKLTRGRFWSLFGAYLLALAVMAVVWVVVFVAFAALASVIGGGVQGAGFMFKPDMSSLPAYFRPLQILYLLVNAPLTAVWMMVQAATPADAYRQITRAGSPLSVFGPTAADRSTAFGVPSA